MHHFGLIRYYNYKNLSYEQFITNHNSASQDPLYQETILTSQALSSPGVLVVRALPKKVMVNVPNVDLLVLSITTPLVIDHEYKGIVGVQADQSYYWNILMSPPCSNGSCLSCLNTSVVDCFLVTNAGLVILNNNNIAHTGSSLVDVDCALMESLVNSSVFISQYLYDFQALCTKPASTTSFANILKDPLMRILRLSMWVIYELFIFLQNLSLSDIYFGLTKGEENPSYSVPSVADGRPCFVRIPSFFASNTNSSTTNKTGTIACTTCYKTWYATGINNTNLILIVVQKSTASCSCDCSGTLSSRLEIKRNSSNPIELPVIQDPNYFSQFVTLTKKDDSTVCSDGAPWTGSPPKLMMAIACTIFILLLY